MRVYVWLCQHAVAKGRDNHETIEMELEYDFMPTERPFLHGYDVDDGAELWIPWTSIRYVQRIDSDDE